MPITYKLVFAGPVGAGKTTAIKSLSDIEVVTTEASISDGGRAIKPTTTVAMDYGLMKLASGDQVRLYGTPGQKRFDFMWDILSENALGVVLLVRADAPDPALAEIVSDFERRWRDLGRTVTHLFYRRLPLPPKGSPGRPGTGAAP